MQILDYVALQKHQQLIQQQQQQQQLQQQLQQQQQQERSCKKKTKTKIMTIFGGRSHCIFFLFSQKSRLAKNGKNNKLKTEAYCNWMFFG